MSDSAEPAGFSGNVTGNGSDDGGTNGLDGAELFPRLEEHIEQLLARFRDSRKKIGELEGVIRERDRQLGLLEQQNAESERVRAQVAERLDRLIAQVDELERAADDAAQSAPDSTQD